MVSEQQKQTKICDFVDFVDNVLIFKIADCLMSIILDVVNHNKFTEISKRKSHTTGSNKKKTRLFLKGRTPAARLFCGVVDWKIMPVPHSSLASLKTSVIQGFEDITRTIVVISYNAFCGYLERVN